MKSNFRKSTFGLSVLVLMSFLFSCQQEKVKENKKTNILFLFADDQRSGTIRALGNQEVITPNIDALVNEGVSFTNAYIMGGTSGAVCAPSRAMLLTGRNLYSIVQDGWYSPIYEDTETIPETFRKAGYTTFGTGKNHNGKEVFARGFTNGDEIFFGGMTDHWNVPVYHFDSTGEYGETIPYIKNIARSNTVEYRDADHVVTGKHSSELFADATIDFLKSHDSSKPFFAYVPFTAPHDPRSMPKEYEQMYDTAAIATPSNFLPEHPWDFGEFKIRDEVLAGFPRTKPEVKTHLRDYYAMITHMDAQIGRIIEALKESGEYENTIIVFSADNGLALGQHGLFGKQNLYEHSIGVPFIIAGPGIPKNERREAMIYLYDVFPTLCELASLENPSTVQGTSFAASIQDINEAHRETMPYGYKEYMRAYRKGDFKLIEYFVKGERHSQFFNLEQDPFEKTNLLEKKDQSSNYTEMKNEMIQEMKVLNDTSVIYKQLVKEAVEQM